LKKSIGYFEISVIEFITAAMILLLALFLFSFIADEMVIENENHFDTIVYNHLATYDSPFNTKAALFITNFGSGFFLIPAYLTILFICVKVKKYREASIIGIVASVSLLSGWLLKDIFHRARPSLPFISGAGGYSFPSGHSLGGFTISGLLIYILSKTSIQSYKKWILSVLLFLFSIMIGISRIYLRVHFASDVMGSFLLTIVWLSLTFILLETIEKKI